MTKVERPGSLLVVLSSVGGAAAIIMASVKIGVVVVVLVRRYWRKYLCCCRERKVVECEYISDDEYSEPGHGVPEGSMPVPNATPESSPQL